MLRAIHARKVLVTQLCLTLCNPMDCGPPGSSVHEISQARILKWVAISYSRGSSRPRDRRTQVSSIGRRIPYHLSHLGEGVHYCSHFTEEQTEPVEESMQAWHSRVPSSAPEPRADTTAQPPTDQFPTEPYWTSVSFSTLHSRLPGLTRICMECEAHLLSLSDSWRRSGKAKSGLGLLTSESVCLLLPNPGKEHLSPPLFSLIFDLSPGKA